MLPLLLAFSINAQEKLVESIEIHVVNVDVVVTDRAGNPVPNLKREDFELYENGKPQTITNFYEVRPDDLDAPRTAATAAQPAREEVPPPEARARHVVIFIDDYSVEPLARAHLIQSLTKFVDNNLRDGDSASVVSWSRAAHVLVPFTTDRAALKAAINAIQPRGSIQSRMEDNRVRQACTDDARVGGRGRMQARDDCASMIESRIDEQWSLERDLLRALRLAMVSLGGMEGKKAMIIAGSQLPDKPGVDLYQLYIQLFGGRTAMHPVMMASSRSQTLSIADVAREANAHGVTLYTIDTNDSRNTTSAENFDPMTNEEAFYEFTNTKAAFDSLAKITGGISIANTSNLDYAFDTVARDLTSWYSLGYRPADDKTTGNRNLRVKVKNPAYRVRTRETYAFKSHDEEISDKVLANIVHEGMKSQWPIGLRTGTPKKDGRHFLVPIEVTVPPTVTLLPAAGNKLTGGFDVYIVVGNDDGQTSNTTKHAQPITIPAGVEKVVRSKPLTFNATLMVRPGKNTLSIAVVDQTSNVTGFARATIVAH